MTERAEVLTQKPMTGQKFGPLDDFPIHQTAETLGVSGDGEPEWFEHDTTAMTPPGMMDRPYMLNWFQFHPNKQAVQAWIMFNDSTVQHNLVIRQPITRDRNEMRVGPLTFEILEPLELYRTRLEPDAAYPFEYDFLLEARSAPKLFDKRVYHDDESGFLVNHCHTDQALVCREGFIKYQGTTYNMAGYQGYRDHCWGRRAGPNRNRGFHVPLLAHFPHRTLSMWYEELSNGEPLYAVGHIALDGGPSLLIESFEHDFEFDPSTGNFRKQEWKLRDETGKEHRLSAKVLYNGGYQRYSDVLAERLHHSGDLPSESPQTLTLQLQTLDLSDPSVLNGAWRQEQRQQYCEFTLDGETGFGLCIYYASDEHVRYGQQLRAGV